MSGWGDVDCVARAKHRCVLTPPAGAAALPLPASAVFHQVGLRIKKVRRGCCAVRSDGQGRRPSLIAPTIPTPRVSIKTLTGSGTAVRVAAIPVESKP